MKLFNKQQRKQLREHFSIRKEEIRVSAYDMLYSLKRDKGFTFGSEDLSLFELKDGYMVSKDLEQYALLGDTRLGIAIPKKEVKISLIKDIIYDWLATLKGYDLQLKDFVFLGGWENEDKVYFDLSFNYENKKEALAFAKANKQLAIWDCAKAQEIKVK